jgi:hypothetical protein
VTERRRWPQRFKVTLHTNSGNSVHYGVATWLSAEKAVAMAVESHVDRYHPGTGPMGVNDVEVADLGPVRRADDGKMVIDKSVL